MPAKIRLQRHGKKGKAFFHVVIADGRAPRDGKFIEKLGTYNPNTNPATIDTDFEKTLAWVQTGAQPTDTVKAILSYRGVMYKNHLLKGVKKGALTLEQAEAKFTKWLADKEAKIANKVSGLDTKKVADKKAKHAAELKVKDAIAAKVAAKNTPPAVEAPVAVEAPAAEAAAPAAEGEASAEA